MPRQSPKGRSPGLYPRSRSKKKKKKTSHLDVRPLRPKIHKSDFREKDLPPPLKKPDISKYENLIYKTKKRKMHIALKDFRPKNNRNYFAIRQGDIVCSVYEQKGWYLVYHEDNPKKFGFAPKNYLNMIH